MSGYDHSRIEPLWQQRWDEAQLFVAPELQPGDKKAYILDMFPYPSGSGLHVGHLLGYTGSDILARAARMQGKKVLHPMGWDAFGLPAENFALKQGVHPAKSTQKNIAEFKRQFKQVGISYDWSREINTSDPEFYKWTQWFFTLLYKRGLAYRKDGKVNWCPNDQTVLANEQVVQGRCERCGAEVVQKELKQWYFKITDYTERLLEGLDTVDWPEKIKTMQRNWIGKSVGARLHFPVENSSLTLEVFTTRPDTVYGATYMVLAPEHQAVAELTTPEQAEAITQYIEESRKKTELERTFLDRKKTGVFTGSYATNPATGERIPIWVADYVIASYGSGAIMAVPAHDERDHEFAETFSLPVVKVIDEAGKLVNSGEFSGRHKDEVLDDLLAKVGGQRETTYRLRDWLVSRQRYWGSPIPIAYDAEGNEHLIPENELPVILPHDVEFLPNGQSPLQAATEWKQYTDPVSGQEWTREVDTLDTFVCSSWYYFRYLSPHLQDAAFDKEAATTWMPVDMYIGGAEHAVLHLLYTRFFTKVLFDAGYITFEEPFLALRNQGIILGPDNNKMSKSKGNVINPDDVIREYGADTLRMYEMFMAPFELEKPWSTTGIVGVRRFLEKVWRLREKVQAESQPAQSERKVTHSLVKKVTEDIAECKFNTAVAAMMESVNALHEQAAIAKESYKLLILVLAPFAPHLAEELWQLEGYEGFVSVAPWPSYNPEFLKESSIQYVVQVNGKVRARLELSSDLKDQAEIEQAVRSNAQVVALLDGKNVRKCIVVPGKLVSFVVD